MAEIGKESDQDRVVRNVHWDAEEYRDIQRAALVLSEREHGDYNVSDIIRRGTRKEVAAILSNSSHVAA